MPRMLCLSDALGMTWENMEINKILRETIPDVVLGGAEKQDLVAENGQILA